LKRSVAKSAVHARTGAAISAKIIAEWEQRE